MVEKTKRSIQWIAIKKKNTLSLSKYAGIHLIADFWFVQKAKEKKSEDKKALRKILEKAAAASGSAPLGFVAHKFSPHGITGVVLLKESHISVHTWPEWNYVAVDVFTCGEKTMPQKAIDVLKEYFQPRKIEIKEIIRGEDQQ